MWTFHTIERVLSIKRLYTAFSAQRAADFAFRGETHAFYELVLLTEGRLGVTAGADDSAVSQTSQSGKSNVLLIPIPGFALENLHDA